MNVEPEVPEQFSEDMPLFQWCEIQGVHDTLSNAEQESKKITFSSEEAKVNLRGKMDVLGVSPSNIGNKK